jgi:hypothetical protein
MQRGRKKMESTGKQTIATTWKNTLESDEKKRVGLETGTVQHDTYVTAYL